MGNKAGRGKRRGVTPKWTQSSRLVVPAGGIFWAERGSKSTAARQTARASAWAHGASEFCMGGDLGATKAYHSCRVPHRRHVTRGVAAYLGPFFLVLHAKALFSCKIFYKMGTVTFSFVFDKYYPIMD